RVAPLVLLRLDVGDRLGIELAAELTRRRRRRRTGAGTFAEDDERGILVLGAVPVGLLGPMIDEGAGRQRDAVVGIEGRARAHPPGAAHHGDEAVVGMGMRLA